jgi:hypothetical protein
MDEEVCLIPMRVVCGSCGNNAAECGAFRPRMVRDDTLPWDVCRWHRPKSGAEEGWDVQEVEPAV